MEPNERKIPFFLLAGQFYFRASPNAVQRKRAFLKCFRRWGMSNLPKAGRDWSRWKLKDESLFNGDDNWKKIYVLPTTFYEHPANQAKTLGWVKLRLSDDAELTYLSIHIRSGVDVKNTRSVKPVLTAKTFTEYQTSGNSRLDSPFSSFVRFSSLFSCSK